MENRYIHFGIVLGLIAAISAGLLGGVNDFTSKVIAENTLKIVNEARKEVLPEATSFKEDEAKEADGMQYIPGFNDAGEVVGYVASVTEAGYGGDINFVVGIDKDAKVTGLNVVTSSETPGLGAKINEKEWQEHWIGKDATYEFNKSVDAFIKALNTYQNEVSK